MKSLRGFLDLENYQLLSYLCSIGHLKYRCGQGRHLETRSTLTKTDMRNSYKRNLTEFFGKLANLRSWYPTFQKNVYLLLEESSNNCKYQGEY